MLGGFGPTTAWAAPEGAQVANGQVQIIRQGDRTFIQASDGSIINYTGFDILRHESVQFLQPDASARVLNRIRSVDPTKIDGALLANGRVYLVNPVGIYFGRDAVVNVGALYAAAGAISDEDFLARVDHFTDLQGQVVNLGNITGDVVNLVGREVANAGNITARDGLIALVAGEDVVLVPVGERVRVKVTGGGALAASGAGVTNSGVLDAGENGEIDMSAGDFYSLAVRQEETGRARAGDIAVEGGEDGVVHVSGELDASRAEGQGGEIRVLGEKVALTDANVDASGADGGGEVRIGGGWQGRGAERNASATHVGSDVTIDASATRSGDGGKVVVWADGSTRAHGSIRARGGRERGDGGAVETSGKDALEIAGAQVDASAPSGKAGSWLLDPRNVTLTAAPTTNPPGGGALAPFTPVSDDSNVNVADVKTALENGTNVTITTGATGAQDGDITVKARVEKTAGGAAVLTLDAARDIVTEAPGVSTPTGGEILATAGALDVVLNAGRNVEVGAAITTPGSVTVTAPVAANLNADVAAGQSVAVTSAQTTLGPNADVTATAGTLTVGAGALRLSGAAHTLTAGQSITVQGPVQATAAGVNPNLTLSAGTALDLQQPVDLQNGALTGTATAGPITTNTVTAGTGVSLTSNGNVTTQALTAANGNVAVTGGAASTATVASANAGGNVSLNAGTVTAGPLTAGQNVTVAAPTAANLNANVTAGQNVAVTSGQTTLGPNVNVTATAGTLQVGPGALRLSGAAHTLTAGQSITVQGPVQSTAPGVDPNLTLAAGTALDLQQPVDLQNGALTGTATAGPITTNTVTAGTGVSLTSNGNVTTQALTAANGNVAVTGGAASTATVASANAGGNVSLNAGTVTAGPLTAGQNVTVAAPTAANLNANVTAGQNVAVTSGQTTLGPNVNVTATAGTLAVGAGALRLSGAARTLTAGQSITVQGPVQATAPGVDPNLTLAAGTSIDLQQPVNLQNGALAAAATAGPLATNDVTAGTGISLTTAGNTTAGALTAANANVTVNAGPAATVGSASAGGNVALAAGTVTAGALAAGQNVTVTAPAAANLNGNVTAGQNVAVTSGQTTLGANVNATATAGTLTVGAGPLRLSGAAHTLAAGQSITVQGPVQATAAGVNPNLTLTAGSALDLQQPVDLQNGALTGTAGPITASTVSAGTGVSLTSNGYVTTDALTAANGNVTVTGGPVATVVSATAGGNVALSAGTVTAGALGAGQNVTVTAPTAANLNGNVSAGQNVALTSAQTTLAPNVNVTATAGALQVGAGPLRLSGAAHTLTAGQAITVQGPVQATAPGVDPNLTLTAGTALDLQQAVDLQNGALTGTATAGPITTNTVSAGTGISLTSNGNVTTQALSAANGDVTVNAGPAATVAAATAGGNASLSAGTVNVGPLAAGQDVTVTAPTAANLNANVTAGQNVAVTSGQTTLGPNVNVTATAGTLQVGAGPLNLSGAAHTLAAGQSITVQGPVQATGLGVNPNLTLTAGTAADLQQPVDLQNGALTATATAGPITTDTVTAGTGITLTSNGDVRTKALSATNGAVTLTADANDDGSNDLVVGGSIVAQGAKLSGSNALNDRIRIEGSVAVGAGGFEGKSFDSLEFAAPGDQSVTSAGGAIALNAGVARGATPLNATILKRGGNLLLSGTNVTMGGQEKLTDAGTLTIDALGTAAIGDLNALSIAVNANTIVLSPRPAAPANGRTADLGADLVGNTVTLNANTLVGFNAHEIGSAKGVVGDDIRFTGLAGDPGVIARAVFKEVGTLLEAGDFAPGGTVLDLTPGGPTRFNGKNVPRITVPIVPITPLEDWNELAVSERPLREDEVAAFLDCDPDDKECQAKAVGQSRAQSPQAQQLRTSFENVFGGTMVTETAPTPGATPSVSAPPPGYTPYPAPSAAPAPAVAPSPKRVALQSAADDYRKQFGAEPGGLAFRQFVESTPQHRPALETLDELAGMFTQAREMGMTGTGIGSFKKTTLGRIVPAGMSVDALESAVEAGGVQGNPPRSASLPVPRS
jgi:filamentous hemagglutinin family protein